jgi:hypothetical protein
VAVLCAQNSHLFVRVTRCVCEKVAQNVAQSIFWENYYQGFTVEKVAQLFWATSVIFTKAALRKQSPNMRKFEQSGHPTLCSYEQS